MEFSPLITRTMKIKLHILPFFLLLSFSLFAQESVEKIGTPKAEIKLMEKEQEAMMDNMGFGEVENEQTETNDGE